MTERRIQALQPDPTGRRRLELRDSQVPGLVVRIAAKRKVYCLHTRFPGKARPGVSLLPLAPSPLTTLAALRANGSTSSAKASTRRRARRREDAERRAREAEQIADECQFRNVAEDYIKRRVSTQRRARATERVIRNVLVRPGATGPSAKSADAMW